MNTIGWQNPGRPVILASRSPRRSDLLGKMGFLFETADPGEIDEPSYIDKNDIERSLRRLAEAKAKTASVRHPSALTLGADTIVYGGERILGKPRDASDAREMLHLLNDSRHTVYTAIALLCEDEGFFQSAVDKTEVYFRKIQDYEIESYLRSGEWADKAGAYAIQGYAMIFVSKIIGCFYTVVGLPIVKTISLFNAYVTRKESVNV